jgi:spoIIIJ-associated protein
MDGALFVDEDGQGRERGREPRRSRGDDDGKADDARRVTQGILDRMDLEASARIREEDDERVVIDIEGPDAGRAIGKKGMTLEALQFLVNKIVNRDPDERRHIVLDSGDYRERHDNGLVSMAKREAKRAVSSGRAVTLEPMSARDRRVIHVSLAKFPGVSTRSEGEGAERRLQIIPVRGGGERTRERDDRPRDDRPRERDDRPRDDRPRERDDRPRERDDRPRDDRPRGERPRAPGRERPERSADERARPRADERAHPAETRGPAREPTADGDTRGRERPVADDDWFGGRDEGRRDGGRDYER